MRIALSFSIVLALCLPAAHAQVKVWEGTLPLAASDEGPPDENPNFDMFAEVEDYPYTMRTDIRPTETVHSWHALFLENEYLKCTILPQLGGHIYTCIDKINGKPMFYANPDLKRAAIAYRGAWSAFGEEFDFPVSHNWVTLSPVDWAYSTAPDGSASVTVGNRDRVYGMDWTVEIVLRPGSTLVEEHVTLSNHSDARHHYFWWNNAGIEVWPDSRTYYPTNFIADNGAANIESWPVSQAGKDLSLFSVPSSEVEGFAYGSNEPFIGVYHPHTDSGVVHWADLKAVPAKKFYSWGNDGNALLWRDMLTNNKSRYVEVQSGLFRDQTTYQFLQPRQAVRFTEFWMPVRGIGSITRANLSGVVALERRTQSGGKITLTLGFNANHAIPGAKITVSDGTQNVLEETASLDPATTWTKAIPDLPADKTYTFLLSSPTGETMLKHTEGVYDMLPRDQAKPGPQPQPAAIDEKLWTDANYLAGGNERELAGDYLNARDAYQSGLAKFPASQPLLKAAGRLADHLWRYQEAASLLAKATELAPTDAEARYYRGIAESALAHPAAARIELEAATHDPSFRAPAGLLLAEVTARQKDLPGALKVLEADCPATATPAALPPDLRCVEVTVALNRIAGNLPAARTLIAASIPRYPTSLFLRNEAAKLNATVKSTGPDLNSHLAADTNRILNLVLQYNRLGLYSDSLDLLTRTYPAVAPEDSEPNAPTPANDPILAYYRGYVREKLGHPAAADYAAAAQLPLLYVFPSEPDEFNVLHAALAANSSDASAHALLGTLLFSKGNTDAALEEWKKAESLNPKIPALQVCMGRVLLETKKQPAEAAAEFQHGIDAEPANPGNYLGLNEAMRQTGKTPAQRVAMMKAHPDPANMRADLARAFADALREAGRNQDADAFLAHRTLPH